MANRKSGKAYKEILGILGVVVLMYIVSNYSNILLLKVFDLEDPTAYTLFFNRLLLWSVLLLFFLFVRYYLKEKFLPWKEKKLSVLTAVLSVIALLVLLFVGFVALILIIQHFEIPTQGESTKEKSLMYESLPLMVFIAFTAGVLEEILFRGYILPTITKITGSMFIGILLSSTIFGLMHYSYGTLHQVIIPIYFGIIFSVYYAKFRNLKVIIFCHFVWNLVVYLDSANLL